MLDEKASGCSQWFISLHSVVSGLEKPLLADKQNAGDQGSIGEQ